MALLDINWKPNRRELRQFGLIWLGFFALIGVYCLWAKDSPRAAQVFWVIVAAGGLGIMWPALLRPVYLMWMALALPIGWTVSHLLLAAIYYLVMTPIGLLMRLFHYDPMQRRIDREAESYWMPHDSGTDAASYFRQF
jgi:fumarate reductase subunit D